ncbi:DUF6585 family protein [Streptomyces sp. NPDC059101]|uniref:DUF6585 family protein n=1 Tax=Streptomyces sp. NPDC059101 TaxID=3346728 RepID=UPI00369713F0
MPTGLQILDTKDAPIPVSDAVREAAQQQGIGALIESFVLVTKVRSLTQNKDAEKVSVHAFEHGLVREAHASQPEVFRWDGIETVNQSVTHQYRNSAYYESMFYYKLRRRDGLELEIRGEYKDPKHTRFRDSALKSKRTHCAELGEVMSRRIASEQLADAKAALARGERLTFADVVISTEGVHSRKHGTVPWGQIRDVKVSNGVVQFQKEGKFLSLSSTPVGKIPNVILLLDLTDALREAS